MQLVFIAHGSRTSFQVTDVTVVVGYDQGALELAGVGCIDAKIGGKLHRAFDPLGYVGKRAITENGTVEGSKEIVPVTHHRSQVLFDQIWVLLNGFTERTENNTQFRKVFLERGLD